MADPVLVYSGEPIRIENAVMNIKFGTSGWRAIIADEFTFSNLRKVSWAIAKYIKDQGLAKRGMVVGYDTRFLSADFARESARSIADSGIDVYLTERDTPTPVIAFQIIRRQAAGGINITASHNPPNYSGIKFSPADGGPALPEVTKEIERNIAQAAPAQQGEKGAISIFDPRPNYLSQIRKIVDMKAIRKARLKIGVDVLYGTGRGYLDKLLEEAGCTVHLLHDNPDPSFGGLPPEPAQHQLKELSSIVRKRRLHVGVALDGDADRFGIIDRDGTYIDANQVLSLLTAHLMQTRTRQKRVARTFATTHMIDALAKRQGLEVIETPVGFKFIGQEIARGGCLIGGEESGGLSIFGHVPEKDGILACLLIVEMCALKKMALQAVLKQLYKEVGPFYTSRIDFRLDDREKRRVIENIDAFAQRKEIFGEKIERFVGLDGHKFIFENGSWLMFRVSGTEPIIRCYLEAPSKTQLRALSKIGHRMILNS